MMARRSPNVGSPPSSAAARAFDAINIAGRLNGDAGLDPGGIKEARRDIAERDASLRIQSLACRRRSLCLASIRKQGELRP